MERQTPRHKVTDGKRRRDGQRRTKETERERSEQIGQSVGVKEKGSDMGRGERLRVRRQGGSHRASPTPPTAAPLNSPPPCWPPRLRQNGGGQRGRWWAARAWGGSVGGMPVGEQPVERPWEGMGGAAVGRGLT